MLRHEAWQNRGRSGLTPTQSQILVLLRRGPRRLTELADELGLSAATASDSLRVLAEKGLAAKERSPADGRSLAARLTPARTWRGGPCRRMARFLARGGRRA